MGIYIKRDYNFIFLLKRKSIDFIKTKNLKEKTLRVLFRGFKYVLLRSPFSFLRSALSQRKDFYDFTRDFHYSKIKEGLAFKLLRR